MAGIIAAIGDNDKWVVGVDGSDTMPLHIVRVYRTEGDLDVIDFIKAIDLCLDPQDGPVVINMSFGVDDVDIASSLKDKIEDKLDDSDHILFIATAGNNNSSDYRWPASMPEVMSVASVDKNKERSDFSQYNDAVDISAPGSMIRSTSNNGTVEFRNGTSMAAPHVTGIAAKIWSHNPSMTAQEVRDLLEMTAEDLGEVGRDDEYGWGLVDAFAAFQVISTSEPCEDTSAAFSWNGERKDCEWVANERMDLCDKVNIKIACPNTCEACNYKCSNINIPFYPMPSDYIKTNCTRIASLQPNEIEQVCSLSLFKSSCRKTCSKCADE